jgi:hypothetical protein
VLRGLAPFGAALLACKAVASVMVVDTWIALGEVCFVSASVYAVILFGFCLTGPDRDLLQRGIRRLPIGRFRTQGKGMTASG